MQTFSEQEVISLLQAGECFEGVLADNSLYIKVAEYMPYIATAIHNGCNLRYSLREYCLLTDDERFYEEDPLTGDFISSLPITLVAMDSRYEYDLNRHPEQCIYQEAWGKQVWSGHLPENETAISLRKHFNYYSVLKALCETLELKFGFSVIYDLHSYNYQRIASETPVFNLGTRLVNKRKWKKQLVDFSGLLAKVELPNIETTVAENQVFSGLGYQAEFVRTQLQYTLCIPLEIKKVYLNEISQEVYPLVVDRLKAGLKAAITEHIAGVIAHKTKRKKPVRARMLDSVISPELREVDRQLFKLAKSLDTLSYINPTNLKQEKKRFLKQPALYQPQFTYPQLDLDPYRFKEALYRIPVHQIQDANIELLYREIIDQLAMRIDLITSVGTQSFLYNSLKYYGQPSDEDIANANFLLHARVHDNEADGAIKIPGAQALELFREKSQEYGLVCRIQASDKIVAGAIVNGMTLKINAMKSFYPRELAGLVEHELGVHLVTSANAQSQPLKILTLGLPGNTHTQEGLAILSEYLSGNLTVSRLQELALRVICVNGMLHGETFNGLFYRLQKDFNCSADKAFSLTVRVFRGGGFTKDYLYLSGLRNALQSYAQADISSLLAGKTAFKYRPLLDELISRKILVKPKYMPKAFSAMQGNDPIIEYLISSIH